MIEKITSLKSNGISINSTRFCIDEELLDKAVIKNTNGTCVNVKDYLKMMIIEVLEESLQGTEGCKNE